MFSLLAEAVADEDGEDAWGDLLAAAGFDGAYTSLGSYPDEEMVRLVEVAAAEASPLRELGALHRRDVSFVEQAPPARRRFDGHEPVGVHHADRGDGGGG